MDTERCIILAGRLELLADNIQAQEPKTLGAKLVCEDLREAATLLREVKDYGNDEFRRGWDESRH